MPSSSREETAVPCYLIATHGLPICNQLQRSWHTLLLGADVHQKSSCLTTGGLVSSSKMKLHWSLCFISESLVQHIFKIDDL